MLSVPQRFTHEILAAQNLTTSEKETNFQRVFALICHGIIFPGVASHLCIEPSGLVCRFVNSDIEYFPTARHYSLTGSTCCRATLGSICNSGAKVIRLRSANGRKRLAGFPGHAENSIGSLHT